MERHRIVSHGDSNSEVDSEETFEHGTEASDEHDSSDEQESISDEGDNDDDSDKDEDEDDDDSSSDSQNSTDDEDDEDSVWSGMRDISWTSTLLSTFNEAKKEFQNQGMTADDAHQEAYQHMYHKKNMSTKRKLQEDDDYEAQEAIKYAVKKRKFLIQEATGTLSDDELDYDIEDEEEEEMRYA